MAFKDEAHVIKELAILHLRPQDDLGDWSEPALGVRQCLVYAVGGPFKGEILMVTYFEANGILQVSQQRHSVLLDFGLF